MGPGREAPLAWSPTWGDAPTPHCLRFPLPAPLPAAEPGRMLGLWRTFPSVSLYLTLAVGLAGLLGSGLVLWHLSLQRTSRSSAARWASPGRRPPLPRDSLYFAVTFVGFPAGLWLRASAASLTPSRPATRAAAQTHPDTAAA